MSTEDQGYGTTPINIWAQRPILEGKLAVNDPSESHTGRTHASRALAMIAGTVAKLTTASRKLEHSSPVSAASERLNHGRG